ncbi:MAG: VWA domain-containing protein [Magnetococcales bacterium]|nr:VWA domain-containing protein [Magnetococcales bacterium]
MPSKPMMFNLESAILKHMAESAPTDASMARTTGSDKKTEAQAMPTVSGLAKIAPAPLVVEENRDRFRAFDDNPMQVTREHPVSTFSVDVDTASYAFVRRLINSGQKPAPDAVRVEEMINYFDYDYPLPKERTEPFATSVNLYPSPWNPETRLMQIGIRGYELSREKRPQANLVFLVDVSGSMNAPDRLPLVKQSLAMLVNHLEAEDLISLAVYAGKSGTVLEPTPVKERSKILAALEQLQAGGSTAGGEGIRLAYELAQKNFKSEAVNRVILATDGDFNVGITDPEALKGFVAEKRKTGVFLSILGVGRGNYHDRLMQDLAQNGNGVANYVDTLNEARKLLVEEASANLFPIAKDVKIQVEFNPARVAQYRLIGYETRALKREDFNNDKVDAGDIGSGHRVTALYEIVPVGSRGTMIDPLRYGAEAKAEEQAVVDPKAEYAFLKIRYKLPKEETSKLITRPVTERDAVARLQDASSEARFATAVAAFGQKLRGGKYLGDFDYKAIIDLANEAKGKDEFGYRAEFVGMVRLMQAMDKP